jgi:hypothetical protein
MWIFNTTGTIPEGEIMDINLQCISDGVFDVSFSSDPPPSAGADGQSVPVNAYDAEVNVMSGPTAINLTEFQASSKPWLVSLQEWVMGWFK